MLNNLTKKEKEIFSKIVELPDKPDNFVAKQLGISRLTVSKAKKKFIKESLLKQTNMPNCAGRGCIGLITLVHFKFNAHASEKSIDDGRKFFEDTANPFFSVYNNFDGIMVFDSIDYSDFKFLTNQILAFAKQKQLFEKEPAILIVPSRDVKFSKADFSGLVNKMLTKA